MIRKNFMSLTIDERAALGRAFNKLFDDGLIEGNAQSHGDNFFEGIHFGPAFLPWHRDFLKKLEDALRRHEPGVTLPFWDWTRNDSRSLNAQPWEGFFGGRDNRGGLFDHWGYNRREAPEPGITLPTVSDIVTALDTDRFAALRGIEGPAHAAGHRWVGGTMAGGDSPLDPLFYLHHCNVDRIWAIWQTNNPNSVQYDLIQNPNVDRVPEARVPIDSPMIGGATPRSQLDFIALGYSYERDPVLETAWRNRMGSDLITAAESMATS